MKARRAFSCDGGKISHKAPPLTEVLLRATYCRLQTVSKRLARRPRVPLLPEVNFEACRCDWHPSRYELEFTHMSDEKLRPAFDQQEF